MFDRLIDWIISTWQQCKPYEIVNAWDNGIRLRFGKYTETLLPGIHWKLPVFDDIRTCSMVWTTISLSSQSLTTKDGKAIVAKAVIKYRVVNLKTFSLEVYDAIDAIGDMTQGIIFNTTKMKTWEECQQDEFQTLISRRARAEARRWGIEIETVTLSDLSQIRSIRLLNDGGSLG